MARAATLTEPPSLVSGVVRTSCGSAPTLRSPSCRSPLALPAGHPKPTLPWASMPSSCHTLDDSAAHRGELRPGWVWCVVNVIRRGQEIIGATSPYSALGGRAPAVPRSTPLWTVTIEADIDETSRRGLAAPPSYAPNAHLTRCADLLFEAIEGTDLFLCRVIEQRTCSRSAARRPVRRPSRHCLDPSRFDGPSGSSSMRRVGVATQAPWPAGRTPRSAPPASVARRPPAIYGLAKFVAGAISAGARAAPVVAVSRGRVRSGPSRGTRSPGSSSARPCCAGLARPSAHAPRPDEALPQPKPAVAPLTAAPLGSRGPPLHVPRTVRGHLPPHASMIPLVRRA